MPTDDPTDDYVAELLKQDAKASSSRYATVGLEAVLPKRPSGKAPKPNTRFLRNILRETDSHNAALLAKEEAEAKARLLSLKNKRAPRDAKSILGKDLREAERSRKGREERPSKRQRTDGGDEESHQVKSPKRRHGSERSSHGSRHESTRDRDHRSGGRKHRESDSEDGHDERRSRHHQRSHRDRDRSVSEDGRRERHRTERRRRERQRSTSIGSSRERRHHSRRDRDVPEDRRQHREVRERKRRRSRSSSSDRPRNRSRDRHRSHRKRHSPSASTTREDHTAGDRRSKAPPADGHASRGYDCDESDTDPLEEILGPLPPPAEPVTRPRGRGATNFNNNMDKHFSADYDPSQDVRVDSEEEDDWDMALEALRDRQKWKQQGAERLKAAGFTDEEIEKWASGKEKSEEDVRWRKKGEGREWDRGKVIGEDGFVDLKAEWGRLKGT
ncbi:hypothetical protein IWZ00DRAFT_533873 [Phyllosticta capitalensis]|uniref:Pre-mRNA-splicing factor 38B n=1 Tax=Phyllosticta capitalensis TaxID=121624 RepID=A0ABR1YIX8_9PEZI